MCRWVRLRIGAWPHQRQTTKPTRTKHQKQPHNPTNKARQDNSRQTKTPNAKSNSNSNPSPNQNQPRTPRPRPRPRRFCLWSCFWFCRFSSVWFLLGFCLASCRFSLFSFFGLGILVFGLCQVVALSWLLFYCRFEGRTATMFMNDGDFPDEDDLQLEEIVAGK